MAKKKIYLAGNLRLALDTTQKMQISCQKQQHKIPVTALKFQAALNLALYNMLVGWIYRLSSATS